MIDETGKHERWLRQVVYAKVTRQTVSAALRLAFGGPTGGLSASVLGDADGTPRHDKARRTRVGHRAPLDSISTGHTGSHPRPLPSGHIMFWTQLFHLKAASSNK